GVQPVRDDAERRAEQEKPQHGSDRRRDGIWPYQERLVRVRAAKDAIGEHGEDQRYRQSQPGDQQREDRGDAERRQVLFVVEERSEIIVADELAARAERILEQ